MNAVPLDILCEDGPLLAVNKPAGLPTQGVPAAVPSLEAQVKQYLRQKYAKPGNVYLGLPHRLDRPVSGVVVFARNSKAAARLAEQFRLREVRKCYLAMLAGTGCQHAELPPSGRLTDWLLKVPDEAHALVVPEGTPGAKFAALSYRILHAEAGRTLVQIELETGRMHQIRVQFASRGWPILGDARYGSAHLFGVRPESGEDTAGREAVALHARRLVLKHPVRYDELTLVAPLPVTWSTFGFDLSQLENG